MSPAAQEQPESAPWLFAGFGLLILVLGMALRLEGLFSRGIDGSDTLLYVNLAQEWSQGNFVYSFDGSPAVYRPTLIALFALALELFGLHDWSIKLLNVIADGATLAVIYLICARLNRRGVGLFAMALYALAPFAIFMARIELAHSLSTLFVTAAFLTFVLAQQAPSERGRLSWLAATGLSLGLAAGTHEELGLLVGGYGLFLLFCPLKFTKGALRTRLSQGAALGSGVLIAVAYPVFLHLANPKEKITRVLDVKQGEQTVDLLIRPLRFFWDGLAGATSPWLAVFLLLCLLGAGLFALVRRPLLGNAAWPLWLPFFLTGLHLAVYSLFFPVLFMRNFLPFIPMLTIAGGLCAFFLWEWATPARFRPLGGLVALLLTVCFAAAALPGFANYKQVMSRAHSLSWYSDFDVGADKILAGWSELRARSFSTTWAREVFDRVEGKVTADRRILMANSIAYPYPGRRSLQLPVYFGENMVYLFDRSAPLERILEKERIAYVLHSGYRSDSRMLDSAYLQSRRQRHNVAWLLARRGALGLPLGMDPDSYGFGEEFARLQDIMTARGAKTIAASGSYADKDTAPAIGERAFILYALPD